MDELRDKFKSILSKASNSANKLGTKKFAGQGHRLGTAETHGAKPKVQNLQAQSRNTAVAAAASSSQASGKTGTQSECTARQQQLQQPCAGTAAAGSQAAASAGRLAPQPKAVSVLEGKPESAAATAPPDAAGGPSALPFPHVPPAAPPAAAPASPSSVQPCSLPAPSSPQPPVPAGTVEQLQACLALINSQHDAAESSLQVLSKLLGNLLAAPQEAKYRHIRLNNPRIYSTVVQVEGALEFLSAVGFEVHAAEAQLKADRATAGLRAAADDAGDDGFAVFLDDNALGVVQEGLRLLQQALPAAQAVLANQQTSQQQQQQPAAVRALRPAAAAAAAAFTAAAAPVMQPDRHTQVLLPAVPDTAVPEWFFDRTGAEVKAEYLAMLRQRQTGELMASKAWKDAQLGKQGQGPSPTHASIRVRFPEGVCLQGQFHVSEPLSSLFEWVTAALRQPALTYELVAPTRKPLPLTGKIGDADLVPAVLLNFRPLSHPGHLCDTSGVQQSFLRDELLQQARAD